MSFGIGTLVIASVVLVSLLAWTSDGLRSALVLSPFRVRERFELHRLLTAGWVHADVTHLLFNMLTLWAFADRVARTLGSVLFVAFYVSAVVVAFIPSTLRHMGEPRYASLGASGAVAAVMFSAVLLDPRLRVGVPFVPVTVPGPVYAVGYLVYSAYHAYRSERGVNHEAHFAGAVWGLVVTYVLEPTRTAAALRHLF
jgi:membrane associated rhomboid family serine protease